MLGVLDRERMELEDVTEDLEVVAVGLVEIKPEKTPAREQPLDPLVAEVDFAAAFVMNDMANRWARALGCLCVVDRPIVLAAVYRSQQPPTVTASSRIESAEVASTVAPASALKVRRFA